MFLISPRPRYRRPVKVFAVSPEHRPDIVQSVPRELIISNQWFVGSAAISIRAALKASACIISLSLRLTAHRSMTAENSSALRVLSDSHPISGGEAAFTIPEMACRSSRLWVCGQTFSLADRCVSLHYPSYGHLDVHQYQIIVSWPAWAGQSSHFRPMDIVAGTLKKLSLQGSD